MILVLREHPAEWLTFKRLKVGSDDKPRNTMTSFGVQSITARQRCFCFRCAECAAKFYSRRPNVYIKLSDVRKLGCPLIATFELKNEVRRYSTSGRSDNAGEIRY